MVYSRKGPPTSIHQIFSVGPKRKNFTLYTIKENIRQEMAALFQTCYKEYTPVCSKASGREWKS
jgi:hypothetical protein